MYTVEMLPASLGDALWIEYGETASPRRILIDGGLVGTVEAIKAKIQAVAEKEGKCTLELVVLTHIDGDHIEGLIKLLGEPDLRLTIKDLWFNGQKHLPDPDENTEDRFLGARHAEFLTALIQIRELPWNEKFSGKTIFVPSAGKGPLPRKSLADGMEIILLSPTFKDLLRLSKRWEEEFDKAKLLHATLEKVLDALHKDRKLAPEDKFLGDDECPGIDELMQEVDRKDRSPANGSSIAFIASYGGKRCLFSGDAYATVLCENAKRLAAEEGQERLALSAFKIPHHGSKGNINNDLLNILDCRRFLISTDGSTFNHPDRQAVARLIGGAWRGDLQQDKPVQLHFNYRSKFNIEWDDQALREKWNYKTIYRDQGLLVSI